jgi:hypothetical protein
MAALTAASWTVTITGEVIKGLEREVSGTLALPGTDTYPDAGIPLPSIAALGLRRNLKELRLTGKVTPENTEYLTRVDYANHKLLLYVSHDTAGATALPMDEEGADAPGPRTWNFVAVGW